MAREGTMRVGGIDPEWADAAYRFIGRGRPEFEQSEEPGLAVEDLHAVARSARRRGQLEATGRLRERHDEELMAAKRIAWYEGHDAGLGVGRAGLLATIDERFGERAHEVLTLAQGVAAAHAQGPRGATKAELADALGQLGMLVRELIDAHHGGFVGAS